MDTEDREGESFKKIANSIRCRQKKVKKKENKEVRRGAKKIKRKKGV